MKWCFWNGTNGYTVIDRSTGEVLGKYDAFRYSSKGTLRNRSVCNSRAVELAQYRQEMAAERELLRRALMLLTGAELVTLFRDTDGWH